VSKINPLHITQAFNIGAKETDLDFFDANLFYDSRLFIDPFLLKRSPVEEERELFKRFSLYFKTAYQKSINARNNDSQIQRLKKFLTFKEPKEINLGYTQNSNQGSGPGAGFAEGLLTFFLESSAVKLINEKELFPEEDFNPKFVAIFADGFGEDGISDLSANLIMDYLISYTKIQAKKWNIDFNILPVQQTFDYEEMDWTGGINAELPENPLRPGEPVVFVPRRLLRSHDVSEKDKAVKKVIGILRQDQNLKSRFSNLVNKPIRDINVEEIRNILITEDSVLKAFVSSLEEEDINAYDFQKDLLGFLALKRHEHAFDDLKVEAISSCATLLKETMVFIDIVKQENEVRDGWKAAWTPDLAKPVKEEVFGRNFRAMGFSFFSKFPTVSFIPQTGTGNGLLDFAVIYKNCRIAVELKKLCNNSLTGDPPLAAYLHGIKRQLPNYVLCLPAKVAIYLTIQHYRDTRRRGKNHDSRANEIRAVVDEVKTEIKSKLPSFNDLYYINIDVSPKKSPSKV